MTIVSEVLICNMALSLLGVNTITNLTTDTTKEAVTCSLFYDNVRKSLLRSHPWNFAIARSELAMLSSAPAFEFDYQYSLPADCLRALKLYNTNEEFKIEGRYLLTNSDTVKLMYIKDITDTSLFDANFVEMFSLALASVMAYGLTGTSKLNELANARYMQLKREAKQWDGQEGSPIQWSSGNWIASFEGE